MTCQTYNTCLNTYFIYYTNILHCYRVVELRSSISYTYEFFIFSYYFMQNFVVSLKYINIYGIVTSIYAEV